MDTQVGTDRRYRYSQHHRRPLHGLLGTQQPHITALTAWRDDGVHTLSTRANGKRVSLKTFERQWQRAGNLFLILTPRS